MLVVIVCLLSAVLFACGNSLQHLGAQVHAGRSLGPLQLMFALVRVRAWRWGALLAFLAFCTHVAALSIGKIAIVQPLILMGIVFAVGIRPTLERRKPQPPELAGAVLTVAGLVVYVQAGAYWSVEPIDAIAPPSVIAITVAGVVIAILTTRKRTRIDPPLAYAISAGLLMGTGAGIVKHIFENAHDDPAVLHWAPAAFIAFELCGTILNQKAYQAGALPRSMPALNVTAVLMGSAFGLIAFGEIPQTSPLALTLQALGIATVTVGLVLVAIPEDSPVGTGATPDIDGPELADSASRV